MAHATRVTFRKVDPADLDRTGQRMLSEILTPRATYSKGRRASKCCSAPIAAAHQWPVTQEVAMSILDPNWKYTHSTATDIRKTFAKARRKLAEGKDSRTATAPEPKVAQLVPRERRG